MYVKARYDTETQNIYVGPNMLKQTEISWEIS